MRVSSSLSRRRCFAIASTLALFSACAVFSAEKKALLIAGTPSHGPAQHEHNAGVLLMQKCLADVPGLKVAVALNGWPADAAAFDGIDAVVIFCDGGARHLALAQDHLAVLDRVLAKGVGLGLLHYAVEPTIEKGQAEFLRWAGGCFEINWSINPTWVADFKSFPTHPVTRGVRPFAIRDEWYFNMRFAGDMKGITPLLVATPTVAATLTRADGPHEGNPAVRAAVARGEPQTMSWAFERADGGRGFGFTGVHYHENWGNENFRKVILNAVLWLAKMEVPANGVASTITSSDLLANLDPKPAPKTKAAPAK